MERKKNKGAHEQLHEPLVYNYPKPKMQTVARIDMVVIEDYYHMTTIDWIKLTHLLSSFSIILWTPFCTSTFTSNFFIAFLDVNIREKYYLSLCIYALLPM